jgi:hypothetical protein
VKARLLVALCVVTVLGFGLAYGLVGLALYIVSGLWPERLRILAGALGVTWIAPAVFIWLVRDGAFGQSPGPNAGHQRSVTHSPPQRPE